MKEIYKFKSKEKFLSFINDKFPNTYEFIYPINFDGDMYTKTDIKFVECNHITALCPAGMQKGMKCKICHPNRKKAKGRPKGVKNILPEEYWGTVYYTKIKDTSFYKIGISSNTISERFQKGVEPIFEIPCKTKEEALGIEMMIIAIYDNKRIIRHYEDAYSLYPLEGGYTETFIEDVLGNEFDLEVFIKRIQRGLFLYQNR